MADHGSIDHGPFVSSQRDAADLVGVSDAEFRRLKDADGFPQKTDAGWPVGAIRAYLKSLTGNDEPDTVDDSAIAGEPPIFNVGLELPIQQPAGFIATQGGRFDVKLDSDSLPGFRAVHQALNQERLKSGGEITTPGDVVRFVFELVGDAAMAAADE